MSYININNITYFDNLAFAQTCTLSSTENMKEDLIPTRRSQRLPSHLSSLNFVTSRHPSGVDATWFVSVSGPPCSNTASLRLIIRRSADYPTHHGRRRNFSESWVRSLLTFLPTFPDDSSYISATDDSFSFVTFPFLLSVESLFLFTARWTRYCDCMSSVRLWRWWIRTT